ncbi:uncharacterized protein [Ptychodera flava]|uniref:uncharacterized protein n=1 Tax=Ptychodera flava TaxID=63121 RepID=UPI00396A8C00
MEQANMQHTRRSDMQEDDFGRENIHRQIVNHGSHSHRGSDIDFDHHKEKSNLDVLQKELAEMREKMTKASVKCHLLHVDLATQFNPFLVDTIRSTEEQCQKCIAAVESTSNEQ